MTNAYQTLTIQTITRETAGFKTFTFAPEEADRIAYRPGQYLTLVLPGREPEIRRSYSIASTPDLQEPLTIGVRRIENGIFSRWLVDEAREGDQVFTIGAGGFFTLPEDLEAYRQLFFFAAGSGITPLFSLLKTVLFSYPALRVVLIYSNKSAEATVFRKELLQLARQFPERLAVEFLFSTNPNLARARLYKEAAQQLLRRYTRVPAEQVLSYLCGPENYMRMVIYALREEEVPLLNIRKENFYSTVKVPAVVPPDTEPHQVTVRFKQAQATFSVQYPDTVLRGAKREGLLLPYSCEAGRCGSCVARCLEGKVWMAYNEVLTDREVAQGLVLTCVGYPVGGDVALEIY